MREGDHYIGQAVGDSIAQKGPVILIVCEVPRGDFTGEANTEATGLPFHRWGHPTTTSD